MIDNVEEAVRRLEEDSQTVAEDHPDGEAAVEACYFDLVDNVCGDCTPEVAAQLRQRTGATKRPGRMW